ncbi:Acg family FMN-binding oxidoreductase [Nocardioides sp. GXQ0305]|uniref:Acg family FMN-binding oxidoreductase n=1 Tax=Nocardioides sp. GXQ0305 TaxID=3423912 RepID=UPI003D7F063C
MSTVAVDVTQVVELACRAPSVHNTQPWRWRFDGRAVELRADHARQLRVSDPAGRNLVISCGAALHHALVAAAGLGFTASVARLPDPGDPDLLARVELRPDRRPTPADTSLLEALRDRRTDRRRFTSWPVPEEQLVTLAEHASRRGARVLPLTGVTARRTVERLIDRAVAAQVAEPALAEEQRAWTTASPTGGIPASSLPPQDHPEERRDRFERRTPRAMADARVVASDQVLAFCTARDDTAARLDVGETLSSVWLRAQQIGLSLVPLSQVIEVEPTRRALRHDVFLDMAEPQLLARVGWLELHRHPLPATPRRPLTDVLDLAPGS